MTLEIANTNSVTAVSTISVGMFWCTSTPP